MGAKRLALKFTDGKIISKNTYVIEGTAWEILENIPHEAATCKPLLDGYTHHSKVLRINITMNYARLQLLRLHLLHG
jgi:hypothetical protein